MMRNARTHDPILALSSNGQVNENTTQYNQIIRHVQNPILKITQFTFYFIYIKNNTF